MPQQVAPPAAPTGLFVNPAAARRASFSTACASLFSTLALDDSAEAALARPDLATLDLLIIDLERFDPELDHAGLACLVTARAGAPVLLLCPFANARWLPALMACGAQDYVITPLADEALRAMLAASLAGQAGAGGAAGQDSAQDSVQDLAQDHAQDRAQHPAALQALRARVREALGDGADLAALAERLCLALCSWPGVAHASLFCLEPGADLQLVAQAGERTLNLAKVLGRAERLLQSPLRHAFPGLLAAAANSMALLDDFDKAGEPALRDALHAHGMAMALALPVPSNGPGQARGALCLLFRTPRRFSHATFEALEELADLAAIGLRMADLNRENEALLVRVTHLSTLDALTGIANRRHGETLLEQEIKRARRYKLPLALIAFDIDRFKAVNDRYGHPVGDLVLRAVAGGAHDLVRTSDMLVRAGGEEFLVIAPHTSAIDGLKMAEKLRSAIAGTPMPGVDQVTVSLGVAQLGEHETADSLTVRVNAALARAKRAGRNCVELAMG